MRKLAIDLIGDLGQAGRPKAALVCPSTWHLEDLLEHVGLRLAGLVLLGTGKNLYVLLLLLICLSGLVARLDGLSHGVG